MFHAEVGSSPVGGAEVARPWSEAGRDACHDQHYDAYSESMPVFSVTALQ